MSESTVLRESLIKKGQETGWDARKVVKTATAVLLIGGLVYGFAVFVLPFLLTMAWNLVSLGIAGGILFVMYLVFNAIWNKLPLINAAIAKYTLGLIVEWDEFIIQEQQVAQAEEDVEQMVEERSKIEGKYIELSKKLQTNMEDMKINRQAAEEAFKNNARDQGEDFILAANRNQTFVETIAPICDDMKMIVDFSQEIYKVLKRKIKNAKADLEMNKDVFYSAQAGAKALSHAQKAMLGDVELNSQAEFAKQRIKEKIALSVGQMRSSMEILSSVSNEQNFRDKAMLTLAKERLTAINAAGGDDAIVLPQSTSFKGVTTMNKFKDLI